MIGNLVSRTTTCRLFSHRNRPKHWGAGAALANRGEFDSRVRKKPRVTDRLAELRKATERQSLLRPRQKADVKAAASATMTSRSHGLTTSLLTTPASTTSAAAGHKEAPARVSFTPSFLVSSGATVVESSTPATEDIVEMVQDDEDNNNNIKNHTSPWHKPPTAAIPLSPSSPIHKKSMNHHRYNNKAQTGAGYWTKRLRLLRDTHKGDCIRFQSGQYPFVKKGSLDMNDPRNRAKSYMDVTLLGEGAAWDHEFEKLTFLGVVHTHHDANTSLPQPPSRAHGQLAWICFTYETAREKGLQANSSLRIYNPVAFPAKKRVAVVTPGHEQQQQQQQQQQPAVEWTICCTQLCERYPEQLPKLPNIDATYLQFGLSPGPNRCQNQSLVCNDSGPVLRKI